MSTTRLDTPFTPLTPLPVTDAYDFPPTLETNISILQAELESLTLDTPLDTGSDPLEEAADALTDLETPLLEVIDELDKLEESECCPETKDIAKLEEAQGRIEVALEDLQEQQAILQDNIDDVVPTIDAPLDLEAEEVIYRLQDVIDDVEVAEKEIDVRIDDLAELAA